MKSQLARPLFRAVVLVATLGCAANLMAVTSPTPAAVATSADQEFTPMQAPVGNPVGLLQAAYETLAVADHDYKGHRAKAMKAIENACKLLGTDISGGNKVREPQPVSDAQLRAALVQVQQAGTLVPTGKQQKKIITHIDKAVSELNIALTIK